MKNKLKIISGIICICLLNSCTTSKNSASSETALRDAAIRWQKAIDSKDIEITASTFAFDAIGMYHSGLPVYGRAENRKAWESVYSDSANQHPITVEQVNVSRSGDLGYTLGKWWSIRPNTDYFNGGRYLAVWRLIEGQWQMVILSANVNKDVIEERQSK